MFRVVWLHVADYRLPRCGALNKAEVSFFPMEKKSWDGQSRVGLAVPLSSGTPVPFLPGSSVGPGWLLELLPSHLRLSQPLKDLSWKPHPEQSLLTTRWPLQAAKEAGEFRVLA